MSSPPSKLSASGNPVAPTGWAPSMPSTSGKSTVSPGPAPTLLPASRNALVPPGTPLYGSSVNSPSTPSSATPTSPTLIGSASSPTASSLPLASPGSLSLRSLTSRDSPLLPGSVSPLLPTPRNLPMPPGSASSQSPASLRDSLMPEDSASLMSLTSRNLPAPPGSVSSLLPTSPNSPMPMGSASSVLNVPRNSPMAPGSSLTQSPVAAATPVSPAPRVSVPKASPPSSPQPLWDSLASPPSPASMLWSSRSSPSSLHSRRSSIIHGSRSSLYSPRAPAHSRTASGSSLDGKASPQLNAMKSTFKKLLTAASRRQYSGLDFKRQASTTYKCILHPRSRFRKWWDCCILVLLLMNLVLVPLHLGFLRSPGFKWEVYLLFSDFVLFVDMMLNFRTGIDDRKQGIVIMDPAQIKQHYLQGWFPVDLVSSLPLDVIVMKWPTRHHADVDRRATLSQLAKLLSFLKLIKISRLFRYGGRTEQIMFYHTTGVYLQLGNILALIFLAVHWHACLQFFVGSLMGFPPQSWISIAKLQHKPWWEQYSWAVHNTVSLMMTNSYGLAHKTGLLVEDWIQVMGMFFGAVWQALLLGYGANLLSHKDYTKNVQRERMQEVEQFMSYYDLPEWLRVRIRSHLNAQHMFLNDKDILSSLSGTLREEVLRHNYSATLMRVPFFAQVDPDFTNAIAERLNAEFYQPHDVIVRRGVLGQKVYFIRTGVAHVISEKEELLETFTAGDYFGQSCLLGAKVRQDNVVAMNHCNILTLLATDFHEVMSHFPSVRGIFQTLLFEMNTQEHAERRRRMLMRRPSSVLILPELRRMGAITPSSTDTAEDASPAHSVVDANAELASPKSPMPPAATTAVPAGGRASHVYIKSPALEEAAEEASGADSGQENQETDDRGGRRDGSDVGGSGSQCKQS